MAKIEIASAFVEEQIGSPVFALKIAEPHSKKNDQGGYDTTSRTFFDVKVSRDSGIDLSQFQKGTRVKIWGIQKTEVRERDGKKYYTLTVWADRVELLQAGHGSQQQGSGGGWASGAGAASSGGENAPQNANSWGSLGDNPEPF